MRVLHVHKDYEPLRGGGGTARHIHGLARALVGLGCEVRVAAPAPELLRASYLTVAAGQAELRRQVAWADIVHVHGARSGYCLAGAIWAALAAKPFCYTPHAYYAGATAANRAAKWLWDHVAEAFIAGRAATTILLTPVWREVLRVRGIPVDRTVIIPNCVLRSDLAVAAAGGARLPGIPAILSVGRLDPVKRTGDVIRALALPDLASGHLHLVGKGEDRAALEALATKLGVRDRITFHGFVDDAGVQRMAAGADVFVLASEQEGLPTVLLEMLLSRLPVVCTRIPGNLAITQVAGIDATYEIGDVAALARLLAAAPGTTVPQAAADAVARSFTWEERAREVLACYLRAAPGDRAAA